MIWCFKWSPGLLLNDCTALFRRASVLPPVPLRSMTLETLSACCRMFGACLSLPLKERLKLRNVCSSADIERAILDARVKQSLLLAYANSASINNLSVWALQVKKAWRKHGWKIKYHETCIGNIQARSSTFVIGLIFSRFPASERSSSDTASAMNATQEARVHPFTASIEHGFKTIGSEPGRSRWWCSTWRSEGSKSKQL